MKSTLEVDIELNSLTPWLNKCFELDLKKNLSEKLKQQPSNYLLIDLADSRYSLHKITCEDKEMWLTGSRLSVPYKDKIIKKLSADLECSSTTQDPKKIDSQEINEIITGYADILTKYYPPENIILIVPRFAQSYLDNEDNLQTFDYENSNNEFIGKISSIFYEHSHCNKICIPEYVVATTKHKWGLDRLHYCDSYYRYLLRMINKITKISAPLPKYPKLTIFSGIDSFEKNLKYDFIVNHSFKCASPLSTNKNYIYNLTKKLDSDNSDYLIIDVLGSRIPLIISDNEESDMPSCAVKSKESKCK